MSFHLKNGRFTKSSPKKKTINLKNQGVYDNGSDDITAENCGESSFEEGLSWRDGRRIAKLGVLAEALGKCSGEGYSSKQVSSCKKKGAPVYYVNIKAAGAIIHSILLVTGIQKFMASI